ncbi:MAG: response regulator, partial [Bdellovibrionota bacterium]
MANPPNGSSILPPDPVIPAHYNILLIEEDPNQKVIYSQMIREIVECKIDVMSGISANTFDYIGRSNYHLVVIDEPSGLSHLETIKRMSPSTAVILVSQGATVEQAVAAIKLGAEDYFKKPFNMDAFQLAVKRGLDRKAIFGQDSDASSFLYLLNSCQLISSALDQSKIFEIVQSYLKRELNAAYSGIYTCHQGEVLREDPLAKEGSQERAMQEVLDIALRATNPMQGMMDDNEFVRFIERGTLTPGYFIMRFRCAGSVDYFCVCLSPARPASLDAFEGRLRMLRAQIEVTGKNIEQYLGVQQLVYVDDATGLYNTRYLNYILDRE